MPPPPLRHRVPARLAARTLLAKLDDSFAQRSDIPTTLGRCFLDTADWRIFGAGWILEIDRPGPGGSEVGGGPGAAVGGGPGAAAGGGPGGECGDRRVTATLLDRVTEATVAVGVLAGPARYAADLPGTDPWKAVAAAVEGRRLLVQAAMASHLQRFALLNSDGKTTARVVVERHVVAVPGSDRHHTLRRVTVIPVRGYQPTAERATRLLVTAGALPTDETLLAASLRVAGGPAPGTKLGPGVPLRRTMAAHRAMAAVLDRLRQNVVFNEQGSREQLDTEFLHEYRVAIRRARSLLKRAEGILAPAPASELADELQWLATLTSPVRDLDVHLEELGPPGGDDLDPLRRYLEVQRDEAQAALLSGLDSPRYPALLERWRTVADLPAGRAEAPRRDQPAGEVADYFVERAFRRVLRRGRAISPESAPEALHDLRKRAKELRYLLECFQTLYPDDVRVVVVKELKNLQDNLGEYQDCQVQAAALSEMAEALLEARAAPAVTLMAMGRLAEEQQQRELRARAEFDARFARFSSPPNQERFADLVSSVKGGRR